MALTNGANELAHMPTEIVSDADSMPLSPARERSGVIDTLKGVAILAVILHHSIPPEWLIVSWSWFHMLQAVAVFAVLLGVNGFRTTVSPGASYLRKRARRLLPAVAITWLVSLVVGLVRGAAVWDGWALIGKMPVEGPGNFFVTLLLEFTLLLPVLRWAWRKSPVGFMAFAFLADLAFEIGAHALAFEGYGYKSCILKYLFAIALGFWIADGRSVLPILPFSLAYLIAHTLGLRVQFFEPLWQPRNVLAFGLAAAMVEASLRWIRTGLPGLDRLGRASYHIFLVQMLWFSFVVRPMIPNAPLTAWLTFAISGLVCSVVGLAFFEADRRFRFPMRTRAVGRQ